MNAITDISLDKLNPHPDNSKFFRDIEGEFWEFFKADINRNGILQPLLVTRDKDGTCTVLSGHQRLRAAKALGFETTPCILITPDSPSDVLFSTNLGRQLTMMERYRLTIHLLEQMEDGRKTRERGGNGQFHHSAQNGPNGYKPRDKVASMVPGVTKHDIETFRKIKELPQPVQTELFKFVEKENPNKRALKVKVNALNDEKRRLKAALRAEKKLKLKKREMDEVREYINAEHNPGLCYDAGQYDAKRKALLDAAIEIPRIMAAIFTGHIRRETSDMLDREVEALAQILKEEREKFIHQWKNQIFTDEIRKPPLFEEAEI